ncbi:hypothetical protein TMPK1_04880 [Rhodospirillales bacterium TMPK1]|uniref:Uncharacterized protein n=1 Tax=Roseiterribacter gracilis TaxID=2812848 RepID=A0A8S8X8S0_9PROT|nr:hypothetical protein TMPK1_04880 [Rhodospirillales bacterium TMPK1]
MYEPPLEGDRDRSVWRDARNDAIASVLGSSEEIALVLGVLVLAWFLIKLVFWCCERAYRYVVAR